MTSIAEARMRQKLSLLHLMLIVTSGLEAERLGGLEIRQLEDAIEMVRLGRIAIDPQHEGPLRRVTYHNQRSSAAIGVNKRLLIAEPMWSLGHRY